ncbi:MAG: DMT family transporter [Rhodobacteraceae bacterium]|nr:DMT family transporter [Paracoccaceae bacterium]
MMRKDRIDAAGAATLVVFAVAMGLNQVLIKLTNDGLSPVFQAGVRSVIAVPVVLGAAWLLRSRLSLTDGTLRPGLLVGALFAVEFVLLFIALDLTSVARASILFYTMPIWVALGAHFLLPGEGMSWRKAAGLALALVGVAAALADRGGTGALSGDLLALAGAVMWAAIALVIRTSALARTSPEQQLLYQLGVSAIILLAVAPLFGPAVRDFEPVHGLYLLVQGALVVGVMFLVWFHVLAIYPASDMAAFGFLAPVFGVILGWAVLGEEIGFGVLAALVLVSAGIWLINRRPRVVPLPPS